ncbi:MAG TPA: FlgD immunoglobulin-like domain containing protein, partial [Candidatus Sumerlaeia bacterium]|nr:FlgD immunoglobulin-like domain containing protein [Candidatus Sumerlaeia bacterium]
MKLMPAFFFLFLLFAFSAMAGEILHNPSLEQDAESDGIPDHWAFLRHPVLDTDLLAAFDGNASVRASVYHNLMQSRHALPGVRYTFSGFVRGEEGDESAQLACEFFSPSQWLHYQRGFAPVSADYAPMAATFLAPPKTASLRVNFRSLLSSQWVCGDAFSLLDEFIANPDFEDIQNAMPSGWYASGAPAVNASYQGAWSGKTQVRCNRENYFYQDMAVYPDKKYALVFHVRTDDDSSISDFLPVLFFDNALSIISEIRIPFDAEPFYKRFVSEMTPPQEAVSMRIALRPAGESRDFLWFDAVTMAAVAASPAEFSPNGDGVYDECAAVVLLNESALVTLHVSNAANDALRTIAVLATRPKGAHSFSWNGRADDDTPTTAGKYRFNFLIQSALLGELEISAPMEVAAPPPVAAPPHEFADTFPLGIWFHLSGRYADDINYPRYLTAVAARGFDTVIASWMNEPRIAEFMDAADNAGLSVIAHNRAIDNLITQKYDFAYDKIPETKMREAATSAALALAHHSSFIGYYIRDEIAPEYLENAKNIVRILRGADPAHPSFNAIAMTPDLPERFEKLDTDVLLHDVYPIWSLEPVAPSTFDSFCASLEMASRAAIEKKRPLWVILQSYGDENLRMPAPAELRCQVWLSLAYNAKGVFFFLAQSLFNLRGVFSFDETPLPILDELGEINAELARLAPTLLTLAPAESLASAPPDHLVKSFTDSDETPHLIVVNKDCLSTRSVELILNLEGAALVSDILKEAPIAHFYEAGRLHIPLTIEAGGGRLIRIEQKNSAANAPHRAPRE